MTPLMASLALNLLIGQSPCFGITSREYLAKATLCIKLKNNIAAEKILTEAVKKYPKDEILWLHLTNLYRKRITPETILPLGNGQKSSADKAKDCAAMVLKINPKCSKAYAYLADIASYNDEYKEAISLADRAISFDQNNFIAYRFRGYANIALGNKKQGSKDLEHYISNTGYNSDFRAIMATAELEESEKNYNQAIKYYKLLYQKINNNRLLLIDRDSITLSIAKCTAKSGNLAESLDIVSKLIKKKPGNNKAYIQRARLYKKLKKNDLAKRDYTKALALKYSTKIMNERKSLGN